MCRLRTSASLRRRYPSTAEHETKPHITQVTTDELLGLTGGVPWRRWAGAADDGNAVCVRCWRSSERRAVAAVSSAIEGAIVSKAVASAAQQRGRCSGVVVDNHVTVTDSRHPALRMAPALSSRRQCPRESCTCCSSQSLWLPACPGWSLAPRITTLCIRCCPATCEVAVLPGCGEGLQRLRTRPVTRGVSSRWRAAGRRPCRVSGSVVREAWGRPGARGRAVVVSLSRPGRARRGSRPVSRHGCGP